MTSIPGCVKIEPASVWISYIFRHNASLLCVLIVSYVIILLLYILYTKQMEALSSFSDCVNNLRNSFQKSSFYRLYCLPCVYYCSKCILFVVLFPITLIYFDSLFRFRNDCSSTTNAWIVFSILFLIQFWYLCTKAMLFSPKQPDESTSTPQIVSSPEVTPILGSNQNYHTNTSQTVIDDTHNAFMAPSAPSMNAPKPMQQELDDDYEEQDRGAVAEYNPFDSDNDENDSNNGDYVVVASATDNIPITPHQIPAVHRESSTSNTPKLDHFLIECACMKYKDKLIQNGFTVIADVKYADDQYINSLLEKALLGATFKHRFIQLWHQYKQGLFVPGEGYKQPMGFVDAAAELHTHQYNQQIPPPPQYIGNEYTENTDTNVENIETVEDVKTLEIEPLITYFKYTTVFFMILSLLFMVTSWRFIPYYTLNISIFTLFYLLLTPFVLLYRVNGRLMNNDYINYHYRIKILDDIPFIVFLLKLSSFFIILTFCMTLSVQNQSALSGVLYLLLPICSIYSWNILCKTSIHLELMYEQLEKQYSDDNMHVFIRPIIPFGNISHSIPSDVEDYNELSINLSKIVDIMDPPPDAGNLDRLESIELSVDEQYTQRSEQYNVTESHGTKSGLKGIATRATEYYAVHSVAIANITSTVNALISFIVGAAEISVADGYSFCIGDTSCFVTSTLVWSSAAKLLMMYSVLLLMIIMYTVCFAVYNRVQSNKTMHKILHLIGSDTKRRLLVFFNTNMLLLQINVMLASETDGAKAILTILSLITSLMLAVITFNKQHKVLFQMPVKYSGILALCYRISYIVSTSVMFLLIIHVTAVNDKQFLMIYSYIGLPFIWLFWCQLYHNEMGNFIKELDHTLRVSADGTRSESVQQYNEKQIPTTYGSLYILNELCMVSSFVVFIICCAMASKSYDGAQDGASLFFLSMYLLLSLVIFINSFVALISMQPQKQKTYKAAMFEPVLTESLLTQHQ